jgi:hypothetical protein
MIYEYLCTHASCGARAVLDDAKKTQQVSYPKGKGPASGKLQRHDCPVARGLWPPEIDQHPLARRVS